MLKKLLKTRKKKWDSSFRNLKKIPPWRGREQLDVLERALDEGWIPQNGKLVDIGCGNGTLTLRLAQRTSCSVLGIDISTVALDQARALASKHAPDVKARLSYQDVDILHSTTFSKAYRHVFGVATDVGCFHNFEAESQQRFIAERIHEMLTANGKWLLVKRAFRGDNEEDYPMEQERMTEGIKHVTAGLFNLKRVEPCDLTGPNAQQKMPGLAFYLEKSQEPC
ncbi:MAG: SAM-dependent methyltransferase [Flavobacteriales bacterium]